MQDYLWFQFSTGGRTPERYKANRTASEGVPTTDQSVNQTNTWRQIGMCYIAIRSGQTANCMHEDSTPKECTDSSCVPLALSLQTKNNKKVLKKKKKDCTSGLFVYNVFSHSSCFVEISILLNMGNPARHHKPLSLALSLSVSFSCNLSVFTNTVSQSVNFVKEK